MLIDVDLYDELDRIHNENEKRNNININIIKPKKNIFTKIFLLFCCCSCKNNNNKYDTL